MGNLLAEHCQGANTSSFHLNQICPSVRKTGCCHLKFSWSGEHISVFLTPADTYDRRVMEYREEMKEMGTSLSKNVRQLGRRMINFVMESGGKIKKAFVSTDSNVFV